MAINPKSINSPSWKGRPTTMVSMGHRAYIQGEKLTIPSQTSITHVIGFSTRCQIAKPRKFRCSTRIT
ncbi:hypothetical protein IAQ61_009765 [Plenodomus lingam]|uniref:uncharacterized protein n=1 Tax=Leptosphaeria maculans TaxID=5022 RepID=UPI0033297381|nr:hypothetical protein IAQ61_009765 [Plenodomus lingam]